MSIYFAYGSTMSTPYLRARVPDAKPLGTAVLTRYRMGFYRLGPDGSGKCTVLHTNRAGDVVHGVLFDFAPGGKPALDLSEDLGTGSNQRSVVVTFRGRLITAYTYEAVKKQVDPPLSPFDWYKQLVLDGAAEHGLPAEYVAAIRSVISCPDPDRGRAQQHIYGSDTVSSAISRTYRSAS
jgi:AIG2-like family